MCKYLGTFWDNQIFRRAEKVRLNTQRATGCWHRSVEEFEGVASIFWQFCEIELNKHSGAAGGRWIQSPHVWKVLVPGAERGSPLALLPPAFLGHLGKIPSFIFYFSPC